MKTALLSDIHGNPIALDAVLRDAEDLCVHASPGCDDGEGIHPGSSDRELEEMTSDCSADVICVGHTHEPMDRLVKGKRIINVGAVSNPKAPDLRASYVLLETWKEGFELTHRRVPYDHQGVIEAVEQNGHPSRDFIISFQRGLMPGKEAHRDYLRSLASDSRDQNTPGSKPIE